MIDLKRWTAAALCLGAVLFAGVACESSPAASGAPNDGVPARALAQGEPGTTGQEVHLGTFELKIGVDVAGWLRREARSGNGYNEFWVLRENLWEMPGLSTMDPVKVDYKKTSHDADYAKFKMRVECLASGSVLMEYKHSVTMLNVAVGALDPAQRTLAPGDTNKPVYKVTGAAGGSTFRWQHKAPAGKKFFDADPVAFNNTTDKIELVVKTANDFKDFVFRCLVMDSAGKWGIYSESKLLKVE